VTSESAPLVVPVNATATAWVSFAPRIGGWAIYRSKTFGFEVGQPCLFVRFGRGEGAQPPVVTREAWVSYPEGLGPRALRDLPLSRIEAAVNQPAYYAQAFELAAPANADILPPPWEPGGVPDWWIARPVRRRAPNLRLRIPEGRGRPDSFYQQVADRFAYLATVSARPATDLAEANEVEVTTVHGWVKEARRRGLLPAGERTRRGSKS
jgi:hypothetical protein